MKTSELIAWLDAQEEYASNGLPDDFYGGDADKEIAIIKAIRAHLQSAVVVREGFKVVPCKPTDAMMIVGVNTKLHENCGAGLIFRVMISAAPDYREE